MLFIFFITGCSDPQDGNQRSNHPLVQTAFGKVQGLRMDEIDVFRGIRYAANTRATRFQAPHPPRLGQTLPMRVNLVIAARKPFERVQQASSNPFELILSPV